MIFKLLKNLFRGHISIQSADEWVTLEREEFKKGSRNKSENDRSVGLASVIFKLLAMHQ